MAKMKLKVARVGSLCPGTQKVGYYEFILGQYWRTANQRYD